MSIEDKFVFIGWNTRNNSDKIWGYFLRPTEKNETLPYWYQPSKHSGWNCCIFWGRRGSVMRFKADITGRHIDRLVESKVNKGYMKIDSAKLLNIWPTFIEEAESKLVWDVLAGKIK